MYEEIESTYTRDELDSAIEDILGQHTPLSLRKLSFLDRNGARIELVKMAAIQAFVEEVNTESASIIRDALVHLGKLGRFHYAPYREKENIPESGTWRNY